MNAGMLNRKITIQKKTVLKTEYSQEIEEWSDYFVCWSEIITYVGKEYVSTAQEKSENIVFFNIRWCSNLADLNTTDYCVLFNNSLYNIIGVENVGFKNAEIKIKTVLRV